MKRFLSLLLVIAMLFSVCAMFTACDSTSVSDKDDDDDKKKDDKESKKDTFQGLKIGLPKAYKKDSSGDTYVVYTNGKYNVSIQYQVNNFDQDAKNLQEEYEEGLEDGIDEGYLKEGDAGKTEGKTRYVYAVMADEPVAMVIAFYATDNSIWIVEITNTEDNEKYDIESMIKLITDWEYSDPEPEDNEDPENPDYPENPNYPEDTQQPTGSVVEPSEPVEQLGGYDGSPVTITFYHNFGANKQNVLEAYIAEFNRLYPTIRIQHQTLGDMDNLQDQIGTELMFDDGPNIALCTPDQIAYYQYIATDPIVALDELMFSEVPVSRADGTQELLGLSNQQYNDLYMSFLDTTRVFGDGMTYAMPFSKNMEVLYYNKTFFEAYGIPVPTTWDEMDVICRLIKEIDPTCTPLGYDSEANLFINYAMQTDGGYIDDDGSPAFNSGSNRDFMQRVRGWYQDGLITTREIYGGFTSDMFVGTYSDTRCYMSVSTSSSAIYYNSPDGSYELGVAMIPQMGSKRSVISGGTDLCIFQKENPQEVIASWLFVEFLSTNTEFQAEFSMATGYLPVVRSATEHPTYMNYLRTADGYVNTQALSTTACLDYVDWCAVPNATHYGDRLTDAITNLVMRCMTWSMSDEAWEIMDIFNMATTDIY